MKIVLEHLQLLLKSSFVAVTMTESKAMEEHQLRSPVPALFEEFSTF